MDSFDEYIQDEVEPFNEAEETGSLFNLLGVEENDVQTSKEVDQEALESFESIEEDEDEDEDEEEEGESDIFSSFFEQEKSDNSDSSIFYRVPGKVYRNPEELEGLSNIFESFRSELILNNGGKHDKSK